MEIFSFIGKDESTTDQAKSENMDNKGIIVLNDVNY